MHSYCRVLLEEHLVRKLKLSQPINYRSTKDSSESENEEQSRVPLSNIQLALVAPERYITQAEYQHMAKQFETFNAHMLKTREVIPEFIYNSNYNINKYFLHYPYITLNMF